VAPRTTALISYSRRDRALVDRLLAALDGRGVETVIDRDDIEKGEAWWERIEDLIRQSHAVEFDRYGSRAVDITTQLSPYDCDR